MKKIESVPLVFSIIILLLPVIIADNFSYGYYMFLRICVCGVFGYLTYLAYVDNKKNKMWVMLLGFILFNPIIPLKFNINSWRCFDLFAAVLLMYILGDSILSKKSWYKYKSKQFKIILCSVICLAIVGTGLYWISENSAYESSRSRKSHRRSSF